MLQNNSETSQEPIRVLLADCGPLLVEQVTAMLSQANCKVLTATDGFEVLCRLPELRPHVLLIASDLPRLSGIQVLSLLRQSPDFSDLPVMVLTGQNGLIDKVRAEIAGANVSLQKPFRACELQSAFTRLFKEGTDMTQPFIPADSVALPKELAGDGLSAHS